ncbi:YXYXY domain-containing protein [Arcicella aurantiaca]|uniref:histidine kinase n=1 Tax=Arcicella aurantiaca TaxID=591202 RepID=A0A316ECJ5_9BACT|nr:sensor histidine kinase [Arcicella aurantiaca]PWK27860.1 YXYXY domain-containing protein [Arcicella aurantiaca]
MKQFLLLIFLCIFQAKAQIKIPVLHHLDTKDGLSSNLVWDAATDADGFTWFATERGLVRYDGHRFFFIHKSTERVSSIVTNTASKPYLYAFFENTGLMRVNTKTYQIDTLQKNNFNNTSPNDDKYRNLFLDSQQKLWWSTAQTVQCLDLKKAKKMVYKMTNEFLGAELLGHFIEDNQHSIWVFGENGVYKKSVQSKQLIKILQTSFSAVTRDENGFFWAIKTDGELIKFAPLNATILQHFPIHLRDVSSLSFTKYQQQNAIWIGQKNGLTLFLPEQNKLINLPEIQKNGVNINAIIENKKEQKLWFCSNEGIFQWSTEQNQIERIIIPESLVKHPVTVNSIMSEDSNTFWLGLSHTGIVRWKKSDNSFQIFKYANPEISTNAVHILPKNQIWTSSSEGVSQLKNGSLQIVKLTGIKRKPINDIILDKEQNLWVMPQNSAIEVFKFPTLQPISLWNKNAYKNYFTENEWHNFLLSPDGKIWLIGWMPKAYGINYFDKKQHKFVETTGLFQQQDKTVSDYFYHGVMGQKQSILVVAGGFNRLDFSGKVIQKVHCDDWSSIFESITWTRIGEDAKGTVWIGTSEGLYAYINGGKKILKLKTSEGLISNDIKHGFLVTPNNAVMIGAVNGFNVIPNDFTNPKKIFNNLILSNLKVLNQETTIPENHVLELERNQTNISLDFSTLDYIFNSTNNYRYRLGESSWVELGNKPEIRFDNLTPNQYFLEVQAGDNSGNWQADSFKMTIYLKKAFYETTAFYIFIILLMAGFFYALYRFRYQQLLKLQHVREKISKDLHDEVGSTMSGISILGAIIQQKMPDNPQIKNFTDRIVEDSKRVGDTLDDIVWSVKPQNDQLDQLLIRMKRFASDLFDAEDIRYQFDLPESTEHIKLSMDERYDIYLIFKEAVNNLTKYAQCSEVKIKIEIQKHSLFMQIKDNGIGFNPNQLTERNGIRNMRSRTENLGGKINIISEKEKGTDIQLEIPL